MDLDVIVPVRRQATVGYLLRSFSRNTVWPQAVTLVSNELDSKQIQSYGLNVRILRFESDEYPIGWYDAALRRNVGIWASTASHILTFDDDQIAPPDLVQATLRILESEPYCWGHHRFIDFTSRSFDEIMTLPPEAGRTRETPPNAWHSWRSAYAGLFAASRTLLQRVSGFDMMFSGRHGGEDQDLGRRLAALIHHSDGVYIHEPPFAWHPEHNIPWDEPRYSNVCADAHEVVHGEIMGITVHRCARCLFYWVPDEALTKGEVSMPFNVSRVRTRVEHIGLAAPATLTEVFRFLSHERLKAEIERLRKAYTDYVQQVSTPDMAISLQTAAFLSVLCDSLEPVSILDLGSGFSSFVFRSYAASRAAVVWTVDDDGAWLDRTRQFLAARGLDTNRTALWQEFVLQSDHPFDVVCYDLGGMVTRAHLFQSVLARTGETTVLVLDDMHKEEYAPEVERALRAGRWRYLDARSCTLDHYGRFCGVAMSAAHPLLCYKPRQHILDA